MNQTSQAIHSLHHMLLLVVLTQKKEYSHFSLGNKTIITTSIKFKYNLATVS
jgi:hypothetical protein